MVEEISKKFPDLTCPTIVVFKAMWSFVAKNPKTPVTPDHIMNVLPDYAKVFLPLGLIQMHQLDIIVYDSKGISQGEFYKTLEGILALKKRPKINTHGTLEERKAQFKEECYSYSGSYLSNMIQEFYDHWSESNRQTNQMRFEAQDFFETGKRLGTWAKPKSWK